MQDCYRCHGHKIVLEKVNDLAGRNPDSIRREVFIQCPMCNGKGYIDKADHSRYYNNI